MSLNDSTALLKAVFSEEIVAGGGRVSDLFDDGVRLILRAILPAVKEVGKNDPVQGGVALRFSGRDVWVHPYLMRQVCTNGAIMARAIETRYITHFDERDPDEVLPEVREAIALCASPKAFQVGAHQMRSAQLETANFELMLLPMISRLPAKVVSLIVRAFFAGRDHSVFALANAITAAARDTDDPDVRWDLEELGGGIFANLPSRAPRDAGHAQPDWPVVGDRCDGRLNARPSRSLFTQA